VSFFLWFAMTVDGDAGGPVGSTGADAVGVVAAAASGTNTDAGGDSEDGVPELDIPGYICVMGWELLSGDGVVVACKRWNKRREREREGEGESGKRSVAVLHKFVLGGCGGEGCAVATIDFGK